MKKIPIEAARNLAKQYGCDMLIIYGFASKDGEPTGEYVQTTYGKNKELCGKTKQLADRLLLDV